MSAAECKQHAARGVAQLLTKLRLIKCPLSDGHSSLSALSALVGLQHLNLTMYSIHQVVS